MGGGTRDRSYIGGARSLEIRFHSPYRHAVIGLLAELGTIILVIALAAALALAAAWIA